MGVQQVIQSAQLRTKRGNLVPDARLGPSVWQHRPVELLGASLRRPPLKEHHRVCAARDSLVAPEPRLPLGLGDVDLAPVDAARGLLHQDPGPAAAERTHQIARHRGPHR